MTIASPRDGSGAGMAAGAAEKARALADGLIDPKGAYWSKLVLLIGIGYSFGPIDIIPNSVPIIGYADQVAFAIGGIALAYLLLPDRHAAAVTSAPPNTARPTIAARLRGVVLDSFAMLFATPLLRLATGAWPAPKDVAAFRRAFRNFTPLPPLMRALAAVPAGREHLTRAMLAGWVLADPTYQGKLRGDLTDEAGTEGNRLAVWSGPPVTFLHLEKTAGMSVVSALSAQFHPLQIDADLRRAFPPHVLTPLPPFLLDRVRRCALIWGHYDMPSIDRLGPGRFTFTFLRDPAERIVSLYQYWRAQAALDLGWNGMNQPVLAAQRLSLAAFLQSRDPWILDYIDNFYVRRLTGQYATHHAEDPLHTAPDDWKDAALRAVGRLDFIGFTEDTGGSLAQLAGRLGFTAPPAAPRVNVTRTKPGEAGLQDPEVQAALARLTRLDRVIYDEARRLHPVPTISAGTVIAADV
jgi:uncharacterized membrane protein YkvA (DUF1232 family)